MDEEVLFVEEAPYEDDALEYYVNYDCDVILNRGRDEKTGFAGVPVIHGVTYKRF